MESALLFIFLFAWLSSSQDCGSAENFCFPTPEYPTLQSAVGNATSPGNKVYILGGSYTIADVIPSATGTQADPIEILPYGTDDVTITHDNVAADYALHLKGRWYKIHNGAGSLTFNAGAGGNGTIIHDVTFTGTYHSAISSQYAYTATPPTIASYHKGLWVHSNLFDNAVGHAIDFSSMSFATIEKNHFLYDTSTFRSDLLLALGESAQVVVRDNVFEFRQLGSGSSVGRFIDLDPWTDVMRDIFIVNNLFICPPGDDKTSIRIDSHEESLQRISIIGNIFSPNCANSNFLITISDSDPTYRMYDSIISFNHAGDVPLLNIPTGWTIENNFNGSSNISFAEDGSLPYPYYTPLNFLDGGEMLINPDITGQMDYVGRNRSLSLYDLSAGPVQYWHPPCPDPTNYLGDDCDQAICFGEWGSSACGGSNGFCSVPGNCTCTPASDWTGSQCGEPKCDGCGDEGSCNAPGECSCGTGWEHLSESDHSSCVEIQSGGGGGNAEGGEGGFFEEYLMEFVGGVAGGVVGILVLLGLIVLVCVLVCCGCCGKKRTHNQYDVDELGEIEL